MHLRIILFCLFVATSINFTTLFAQTTVNPDISFIGTFSASVHDQKGEADTKKVEFDLEEIEIYGSGALNPYARADVTLAVHQEGIHVEEGYVTLTRGLPLQMQLKAGKYLVDVGKLNTQHPHQWLWMERPAIHHHLFGEEGFRDIGFQLNTLHAIGKGSLHWSLNLLKNGGLFLEEDWDKPYAPSRTELATSSRFSLFYPTGEDANMDVGVSFLRGQFYPQRIEYQTVTTPRTPDEPLLRDYHPKNRYATVGALDFKWKYTPDQYNGFQIIAEYFTQSRTYQDLLFTEHSGGDTTFTSSDKKVTTGGWFATAQLRWARRFDFGVFYDYAQDIADRDHNHTSYGVFGAFSIAEESTRFGVQWRRNQITGSDPFNKIQLQVLWMLGPHRPHAF